MLRVIAIVFISFALSACRTDSSAIDTAPASQQSAASSSSQQSTSNGSVQQSVSSGSSAKLPATIPAASSEKVAQQSTSSSGTYKAQPVSPPESADEVLAEEVLDEPVSVTLEWTIPMHRENGDLLGASDLDGYIIEYSSQPGSVEQEYVEGGQVSSHSLSLPAGSYQFRVIAVDNNGLTSNPSDWINADLA